MNNNIATVAVEKTFFNIDSDFDYLIPDDLVKEIKIGTMVKERRRLKFHFITLTQYLPL